MEKEKCGICKFWFVKLGNIPGFVKKGECKRYPVYVNREEDEDCGEFSPLAGSKYLNE